MIFKKNIATTLLILVIGALFITGCATSDGPKEVIGSDGKVIKLGFGNKVRVSQIKNFDSEVITVVTNGIKTLPAETWVFSFLSVTNPADEGFEVLNWVTFTNALISGGLPIDADTLDGLDSLEFGILAAPSQFWEGTHTFNGLSTSNNASGVSGGIEAVNWRTLTNILENSGVIIIDADTLDGLDSTDFVRDLATGVAGSVDASGRKLRNNSEEVLVWGISNPYLTNGNWTVYLNHAGNLAIAPNEIANLTTVVHRIFLNEQDFVYDRADGSSGSIDANAHRLWDIGGDLALEWNDNRILYDGSGSPMLQWLSYAGSYAKVQVIKDLDDDTVIFISDGARTLNDTDGAALVDWISGLVKDKNTNSTIHWLDRQMFWTNGTTATVDWGNGNWLKDKNNKQSVHWLNRYLYLTNGVTIAVDWADTGDVRDRNGFMTIDWLNRDLWNTNGTIKLVEWQNNILRDYDNKLAFNWKDRLFYWTNGSTVIIDGNLQSLTDQNNRKSADWLNRRLYDDGGVNATADWETNKLYYAGVEKLDWRNGWLREADGSLKVDWHSNTLFDSTGNLIVNWGTGDAYSPSTFDRTVNWNTNILFGLGGLSSWDWNNRWGYASDGTTVTIDYNLGILTNLEWLVENDADSGHGGKEVVNYGTMSNYVAGLPIVINITGPVLVDPEGSNLHFQVDFAMTEDGYFTNVVSYTSSVSVANWEHWDGNAITPLDTLGLAEGHQNAEVGLVTFTFTNSTKNTYYYRYRSFDDTPTYSDWRVRKFSR